MDDRGADTGPDVGAGGAGRGDPAAGDAGPDDRQPPARGQDRAGGGARTEDGGGARTPAGPTFTRREFAAAGAALLAPVAAGLSPWPAAGERPGGRRPPVRGGDDARRPDGAASPGVDSRRQDAPEEPPGTGALVDYVKARWGDRLSEDDLERIRGSVAGNLRAASALDDVELANADEPGFVFRPYRGEAP